MGAIVKIFLGMVLPLFFSAQAAHAVRKFETLTPASRPSVARAYREMRDDHGVMQRTLVPEIKFSGSAKVEIDLDAPLMFQWYLNDKGKVVQYSYPFYEAKFLAVPASVSEADKKRLTTETFYLTLSDVNTIRVVNALYNEELPKGASKPIAPLPWDLYNPKGTWAWAILETLETAQIRHLLDSPPGDMAEFCPKFASLSRERKIHFWQSFVNQISQRESGFVPMCASDEGKYNPDAKGVISSGLVQISLASVTKNACYQAKGCTVIRSQDDLFVPEKNLACGLAVMSCLATRASCISCKNAAGKWDGIAAYWSTLRDPHEVPCSVCESGKVRVGFKPEIKAALKTTSAYCF